MSNQIDGYGIHVQTLAEIINDIVNGTPSVPGFKQIYGNDINVEQNTPDGQMINIFALSEADILDLIVQDYNSKDPDQAVGVALDAVSQLCGIIRQGGTYTEVNVVVTTDRSLNLNGLDTSTPFAISDNTGNIFHLITSASLTTGANTLAFRSQDIGFIQILANTLTTAVDRVLGVVSVNNPAVPYQFGQDQETDAQLRLRRQASVALPAQGILDGLLGGLNNVEGLLEAVVYENRTSTDPDTNGVPAHSIWVIVDGGADADVAAMIYRYRNAGCGMYGATSYSITQVDGTTFVAMFDRAVYEDLDVQLYVSSLSGGSIDKDAIKTALAAQYLLGIYDTVDITSIIALVHSINPDVLVTQAKVKSALGGAYADSVIPSARINKFVLSAAHISILDTGESSSSCSSSRSSSSSSRSSSSSSSRSSSSSCRSSSSSSSA